MPPVFSNSNSKSLVGLDIEAGSIAATEVSTNGTTRVVGHGLAPLAPGVFREGEILDVDALAEALKELFGAHKLSKTVRLGIANQKVAVRTLFLPPIEDPKELETAIRFQAQDQIPMPLDQAILDWAVIRHSATESGEHRMEVVVVAARRSMVDSFVDAVRGAGLRPQGIDLDAFALVRALAVPSSDAQEARVYCHLVAVANLAVAVGDSCFFTRPLMATWRVAEVVQAATSLAEEVRLSIDYYLAQPGVLPVADAVLSGPGAQNEELVAALAERLALPVSVAESLGGLDAAGVPDGDEPHRYTVAAGLALGAAA